MYKNLYDQFAHWYHEGKGTIWFYSDPHFNDMEAQMLRQNNVSDEEQVKRINSKVGKYDTLVILGDIGDVDYVRKLRGYKVLVMGNHDKGASNYKKQYRSFIFEDTMTKVEVMESVKSQLPKNWSISIKHLSLDDGSTGYWRVETHNGLFDEVYEGALLIAPNIILSHEPVNFPFARNIHGHTHGKWGAFNMCAEFIDYTPVQITRFIKWGFKDISDIHQTAINNAIDNKLPKK